MTFLNFTDFFVCFLKDSFNLFFTLCFASSLSPLFYAGLFSLFLFAFYKIIRVFF